MIRRLPLGGLDELDEHAPGGLGVEERDLVNARPTPRDRVEKRHAERREQRERGLDALDLDRDVVKPRPALLEEFREPVVALRLDELDARRADRQEGSLGALGLHELPFLHLDPERRAPLGERLVDARNGDGDVIATIDNDGAGGVDVSAPFAGVLRGLIHPTVEVTPGMKIGDLDPRADPTYCFTVSDKSLAIGGGVLEAVLSQLTTI